MSKEILSFEEALARLCDEEANLSSLELHALSGPSRAETALFEKRWAAVHLERRRKVIRALVESAELNFEMDFNDLFRCCLRDEDEQVRFHAIEGLWECESTSLIEPLVQMLRHDLSPDVRAAAALSLGRFALQAELGNLDARRVKLVQDALWESIHDPAEVVSVRRRAVESIAYLDIKGVREIIDAAYNSGDDEMRASAIFAMGRSGDSYWNHTVLMELSAVEPEMRYEAARASGELQLREAVPLLIRLVRSADREIQEAAIWSLGQIGGDRARRVLERAAQSDDEVLSAAADDALAELNLGESSMMLFSYETDDQDEHQNEEDWDIANFEELEDWDREEEDDEDWDE